MILPLRHSLSLSLSLFLSRSLVPLSLLSCLMPSSPLPFHPCHTYSQDRQQQQQQQPSVLHSGMHLRPRGKRNGRSLSDLISLEMRIIRYCDFHMADNLSQFGFSVLPVIQ
jgi:hypothetical protein